jgi:hypothetical protein
MLTTDQKTGIKLESSRTWSSFEQFRKEGSKALESIKEGIVGTLFSKSGQYRIMREKDFQKLYGLARDVERLRGGLQLVTVAIRAVQKHPDAETIKVLEEAIAQLGNLPALPTRDTFSPLGPENKDDIDNDDDVILNPKEIERPFSYDPKV